MFTKKTIDDLESKLKAFTHCWLKFRLSGDIFAAKIESLILCDDSLTIVTSKMSRCKQFVIDELGTQKWFPVHHHTNYSFKDINFAKIRKVYAKMNPLQKRNPTLSFHVQNGDEVIFTSDPAKQNEIEEIINKAL